MAERYDQQLFLSTLPATRGQRWLALMVLAISLVVFVGLAPFAHFKVRPLPAFVPAYHSARFVTDLITAGLLFALYAVGRSRAVLVLAGGYLFSALSAVPSALATPRLFAPLGLFGNGPQTTGWLYIMWRIVFACTVLAYALIKDGEREAVLAEKDTTWTILGTAAVAVLAVAAVTWLSTTASWLMPRLMHDINKAEPLWRYLVGGALIFDVIVVAVLWARRRSLLDLWLIVVMASLIFDIGLSAFLGQTWYRLGSYAGRIYGLMAASFVLVVLLAETTALYGRLARSAATERRERDRRIHEMESVLLHLSRVSELAQMVSGLIHEVNQPLAAISNYLAALQRQLQTRKFDAAAETLGKAVEQAKRATGIVHRLREFVVKRKTEKTMESLPQTIDDAVAFALVAAPHQDSEVEMRFDPKAAEAFIDRIQIEQVLFNLVRNAAEAMAGSARHVVTVSTLRLDEERIEITVADKGPGLPASVRARLFEPFVTTKTSGMGVGLSVCRVIVEAHGGKLEAEDNPGGGTMFRFTVPASSLAAGEMAEAASDISPVLPSSSVAPEPRSNVAPFPKF